MWSNMWSYPILSRFLAKKIADVFEAVQTAVNSKKPEKARKIKKIGGSL